MNKKFIFFFENYKNNFGFWYSIIEQEIESCLEDLWKLELQLWHQTFSPMIDVDVDLESFSKRIKLQGFKSSDDIQMLLKVIFDYICKILITI